MNVKSTLFWNVDTQKDFMDPDGKLSVPGAIEIKENLKAITRLARKKRIRVVNTADYHYINSPELDKNPDFKTTFPEHCMAGTDGAEYIKETNPPNPIIFDWDKDYMISEVLLNVDENKNFIIRKDAFDVFSGNPHTDAILEILNPETVFVYGVTTNICVDFAVEGLIRRGKNVVVVKDAVKELPGIDLPFEKWEKFGVRFAKTEEIESILNN